MSPRVVRCFRRAHTPTPPHTHTPTHPRPTRGAVGVAGLAQSRPLPARHPGFGLLRAGLTHVTAPSGPSHSVSGLRFEQTRPSKKPSSCARWYAE